MAAARQPDLSSFQSTNCLIFLDNPSRQVYNQNRTQAIPAGERAQPVFRQKGAQPMGKKLSEMTREELWALFPIVLTEH